MKCDELEEWYAGQFSPSARVYGASEVKEAIDELKTEHHRERHEYIEMVATLRRENAELKARISDLEKLNHDLCERVTENDDIRLHWEEIEQTRAANERLKAKLENVQASAYADSVDAGMRERRIRRALWLARAERASDKALIFYFAMTESYNLNINGYSDKEKGHTRMRTAKWWRLTWLKVERKCRAKAEEYK